MSDTPGAARVRVRLLLADQGAFHEQTVAVPAGLLAGYERLIDGLREDPAVLKELHVDVARLAAAWLVPEEA